VVLEPDPVWDGTAIVEFEPVDSADPVVVPVDSCTVVPALDVLVAVPAEFVVWAGWLGVGDCPGG
jgi:hypothetical protein